MGRVRATDTVVPPGGASFPNQESSFQDCSLRPETVAVTSDAVNMFKIEFDEFREFDE
jgi:hypothetical protein